MRGDDEKTIERGDEGQGKGEAGAEQRAEDARTEGDTTGADRATGKATEPAGKVTAGKGIPVPASRMQDVSWLMGTSERAAGSPTAVEEAKGSAERDFKGYPALRMIPSATSGFQRRIVLSMRRWVCVYISCLAN